MFTAGSETVSSMLSFGLYELALNKEIQDKLRAEICSMKAKHDGQLNHSYLMDLTYANMVLDGMQYSLPTYLKTTNKAIQHHRQPFILPEMFKYRYIKDKFLILIVLYHIMNLLK